MSNIKITISNPYLINGTEEFYTRVDMSDLPEVEMCVSECIGIYLEMHEDQIHALDASYDSILDACEYMVEEVSDNED